jgi:hypothetical protein
MKSACNLACPTRLISLRGTCRQEGEKAMSKAHLPPVPPEQRAKVPGGPQNDKIAAKQSEPSERSSEQRGQNQNIEQNTHHQGFQQDR